jgi:hypothetical protein
MIENILKYWWNLDNWVDQTTLMNYTLSMGKLHGMSIVPQQSYYQGARHVGTRL